jgi:hypothetical protein
VRGQSQSALVTARCTTARWNKTSRAGKFRARLISARGAVFTLAQPGSLIKTSVWPQRASKRPIRGPLSTSRQIPSAPHAADGAA